VDPLFVYDHTANPSGAIIGGAFYNPPVNNFPNTYTGKYFFADLNNSWIHYLDLSGAPAVNNFATGTSTVSGMMLGPDGSIIYLQRSGTQGAFRIRYADSVAPGVNSESFAFDNPVTAATPPHQLVFNFSEYVGDTLTVSDLTLQNLTTSTTVPSASISLQYNADAGSATFRFPGFSNGVLPDGNYRATLSGSGIADNSNNPLGADHTFDFFVFAGDANRDRTINVQDFNTLASNYNQTPRTFTQGDFNYDNTVNVQDFNILAAKYNTTLPASPAADDGGARAAGGAAGRDSNQNIGGSSSSDDWLKDVLA
jgi:hypothetical protein